MRLQLLEYVCTLLVGLLTTQAGLYAVGKCRGLPLVDPLFRLHGVLRELAAGRLKPQDVNLTLLLDTIPNARLRRDLYRRIRQEPALAAALHEGEDVPEPAQLQPRRKRRATPPPAPLQEVVG